MVFMIAAPVWDRPALLRTSRRRFYSTTVCWGGHH